MAEHQSHKMSLMSKQYLDGFVADFAEQKELYLAAVEKHGSPLYFLETKALQKKARQFKSAFSAELPDIKCYFAMKSNNLPLITKLLIREGFGIDVSSGMELSTALEVGAGDIIFSGPGKTFEELAFALENASKVTLLIDSSSELEKIKILMRDNPCEELCVGIRLNNNPSGLWRKFGIPLDQLQSVYHDIKSVPLLKFKGLQFHSSWNLDPGRQAEFIEILGDHLKTMPRDFLDAVTFIDIGGGYWPQQGEWLVSENPVGHYHLPAQPIEAFAGTLAAGLKKNILNQINCTICFEPGRWICNDAMHILMRVVDKKEDHLVITDAGTNSIGWERFETDYFPVINLSDFELTERPCHVLGSLCTPHDVWGFSYFGKSIAEGDVLMIPTQGAYTYSLRQNFIKPIATVVSAGNANQGSSIISCEKNLF